MGNQNKKSNINKTKEKNEENKDRYNMTKNLIIKNTIFKNIQTISKDICQGFEIFQLKSKNNSIYIAFLAYLSESNWIIFYKYIDKTKIFKEISRLKINTHYSLPKIKLKYFYNPLNNKEYIFMSRSDEEIIEIYLIKGENKYKNIKIEYKDIYRRGFNRNLETDLFEVFYNEYDKNIYVIISYIIYEYCCFFDFPIEIVKYIDIMNLEKKELKLIKTFTFDLKNNGDVLNLIYKNNKNYSIIIILNNNIQIIEIKEKNLRIDNLVPINNKLNDFLKLESRPKNDYEIIVKFQPYSIINDINKDYLYITKYKNDNENGKKSDLVIIDLFKKEIFKYINLTFFASSFIQWNNNNIIFMTFDSFYIFDINTYQITTKYFRIGNCHPILNPKPFFSKKHKFYCLFLLSNELIYYFNNI